MLSRKEVLDFVFDEDEFDGYISDSEIERITRHNDYEYDELMYFR